MPPSPTKFEWKLANGDTVEREVLHSDDSRCSASPYPELVRHLVTLSWRLSDPSLAVDCLPLPEFGYGHAADKVGASAVIEVFGPLGAVQRWCLSNGLFDLSALIVSRAKRKPGDGFFAPGTDCTDHSGWKRYVTSAADAVRANRASRPDVPTVQPAESPIGGPLPPAEPTPAPASPMPGPFPSVRVRELVLRNVRCFAGTHRVSIAPITLLYGLNDTGKTTILRSFEVLARSVAETQRQNEATRQLDTQGRCMITQPVPLRLETIGGLNLASEVTRLRGGDTLAQRPAIGIGLTAASGDSADGLWSTYESSSQVADALISRTVAGQREETYFLPGVAGWRNGRAWPEDPNADELVAKRGPVEADNLATWLADLQDDSHGATDLLDGWAWPTPDSEGPFGQVLRYMYQALRRTHFLGSDSHGDTASLWVRQAQDGFDEATSAEIQRWNAAMKAFLPEARYEIVTAADGLIALCKTDMHDASRLSIDKIGTGVMRFLLYASWLTLPVPSTFLLQEPEAHLHPAMQASLADFVIDAAGRGHTIVIETHSQVFAERIARHYRESQRGHDAGLASFQRIASAHQVPMDECLALRLVQQDDGYSYVRAIELEHDGAIPWPRDFFGQQYRERLS